MEDNNKNTEQSAKTLLAVVLMNCFQSLITD
jgi:hypothetical protein